MVFAGTHEHTIDSKNRLAIPAEIRAQIQSGTGENRSTSLIFFVTLGEGQSLYLYTEQGFNERAQELLAAETDPDQLLAYERVWFSLSRRVEADSSGRITLPEPLIDRANLDSEIVLLGVNDHLEIRDRTTWCTYVEQVLTEQPQILMDPRRVMRN